MLGKRIYKISKYLYASYKRNTERVIDEMKILSITRFMFKQIPC